MAAAREVRHRRGAVHRTQEAAQHGNGWIAKMHDVVPGLGVRAGSPCHGRLIEEPQQATTLTCPSRNVPVVRISEFIRSIDPSRLRRCMCV